MTITNKSLSYALRSLYPGAFASYQGVIFRVMGPEKTTLSGVYTSNEMMYSMMEKLMTDSGKRLTAKAIEKLKKQVREDSNRSIPINHVRITVPTRIDLRFDESLDMVYCSDPQCGTLDKLSYFKTPPKDRMPTCRRCRKAYVHQAPVWIPQRLPRQMSHALLGGDLETALIRNMGTAQIFCHHSKTGDRCTNPLSTDGKCVHDFIPKLGSLKMEDPQRPIDSLRRYNPHCPKGLNVPPKKLDRLFRTKTHWYKMDFPRESMSVPLQVSAVEEYKIPNDTEINEVNEVLANVKPLLFNSDIVDIEKSGFSRMQVLEMTYGYRIGNRFTGISTIYPNGQANDVIGRITETQGFLLVLKPSFHDKIESLANESKGPDNPESLKEIAAHSLKHALLVLAPMYTGFEPEKFYGSYDILKAEEGAKVYVYDTDEGGNGGFAALMKDRNNLMKMFEGIQERLECPTRECSNACKQCLFIKNCGNVNRKLSRKLLLALNLFCSK
jgi:hypothetical protein